MPVQTRRTPPLALPGIPLAVVGGLLLVLLSLFLSPPVAHAGDPALNLVQTIPTAYRNDNVGRTYELAVSNPSPTTPATNLSVQISIPGGFSYVAGSVTNDQGLTEDVTTGAGSITIDFVGGYDLPPGDTLTLTYQMVTDCSVPIGQSALVATAYHDEGTDISNGLVTTEGPLLEVDLTANPSSVLVGDTITCRATVSNNGDGSVFSVDFRANWGAGLDSPTLVGGNLTPSLVGDSFQVTTGEIPGGESRYFDFTVRVADCENLVLEATGEDPCEPGVVFSDDSSPFLVLKQPNVGINAPSTTIPYCGSGTVQLEISNPGDPSSVGPALNFSVSTNLPSGVTISNLAAGWTRSGGTFSYGAGDIEAGDTVNLTFDMTPDDPCTGASGNMVFMPTYENSCGDPFAPPAVISSYSSEASPSIGLDKTAVAAGGDSNRIFLGEGVTFTVTPSLTRAADWSGNIVVTDTVPATFTVDSASASAGTLARTGNDLTWTLTPAQAAAGPSLTIEATATTDPCLAGQSIGNTAAIANATTTCGCVLSASGSVSMYLQSKELTGGDALSEIKDLVNLPAEGSYDVCGATDITYEVTFDFAAAAAGTWTGSELIEEGGAGTTYVGGTAQYDAGSGWTAVPGGSITGTSPLTIDLTFLAAEFGGDDDVAGRNVSFRYTYDIPSTALAACTSAGSFIARNDLVLANATSGCDTGGDRHFYVGVNVPLSRADMSVGIGLGTNSVSRSQTIRPTVSVNKETPWNNNNVVVTVDTANYEYQGIPSYTGFGGQTPTVTVNAGDVTFAFANPLGEGEGGTISFDAAKKCNDAYGLGVQLDWGDDCGDSCTASASASPILRLQGDLSIYVTPNQVQASQSDLSFTVYVTNKGDGTAYNGRLQSHLKDILDYVSSTVDGAPATPDVDENGTDPDIIEWDLGSLAANQTRTVVVDVSLNGTDCDYGSANEVVTMYGYEDSTSTYQACQTNSSPSTPVFSQTPSLMTARNLTDAPTVLCSNGTIKLRFKNTGMTHNYNLLVTQHLNASGLTYVPGTATLDGAPVSDPLESGTDLIWTWDSGEPNHVPALEDMDVGVTHTLAFEVTSGEEFNASQTVGATITWQKPCEHTGVSRSSSASVADFSVPVDRPEITVDTTAWNQSAGQTSVDAANNVYGGQNDYLVFKVVVANSGDATAREMILFDSISNVNLLEWDDNASFSSPTALNGTGSDSFNIPDLGDSSSSTYYVRGRIQSACANTTNTASVEWGCPGEAPRGGLTTPTDNSDGANLVAVPSIGAVNISQTVTNGAGAGAIDTRGLIEILVNNGGGTARNLVLTDTLPTGYELDDTFAPAVTSTDGELEHVVLGGTATAPVLSLFRDAGSVGSTDPQVNVLRHGETATVTLRVVRTGALDTTEDETVREETPGNGLDPSPLGNSTNQVDLDYEDSCGTAQAPQTDTVGVAPATPDLDVDITDPLTRIVSAVGDAQNIEVVVYNRGDAPATGTVSVNIGAGWQGSLPAGWAGGIPGTATATVTLAAGASTSTTFNLQVNNETNPLSFDATVEGDILKHDGSDTGDDFSLDSIRCRVLGFRMTKDIEATSEAGSTDPDVHVGEDVVHRITAVWFGLSGTNVANAEVTDTFPNGMGYVGHVVNSSPGGVGLASSTTPASMSSGTVSLELNPFSTSGTFQVDVTTRVVNSPLNADGSPNDHGTSHTDTAECTFDYLGGAYTTGTTGYPDLALRQESVTVRTPSVTIDKQVRNVTRDEPAGAGNYAESVSAESGETLEYRVEVANAAGRATAYDVEVYDTLPGKLTLVAPGADGIDNDGDGTVDDGTDGTVSGQDVVFDGTHNATLAALPGGAVVTVRYRATVDEDVNPDEVLPNTAHVDLDTLSGASGSQSAPQGGSGTSSGARTYQDSDGASVSIDPVTTTGSSKSILQVSNTPLGGASPYAGPQNVVVGEEVEFQLQFVVPSATLLDWRVVDNLPAGLVAVEAADITLPGVFTPGGTISGVIGGGGDSVTWDLGDQTVTPGSGPQTIVATFIARVENTDPNQEGVSLVNEDAYVTHDPGTGVLTVALNDVTLDIVEPAVTVTKDIEDPDGDSLDAGDRLRVTVEITNNSTDVAAYDVDIRDVLTGTDLTYTVGSHDGDVPDSIDTSTANEPEFRYNEVAAGATRTFWFDVVVDQTAEPREVLDNTLEARWHSLPDAATALNAGGAIGADGDPDGMRNGQLPADGGTNDYETSATDSVTMSYPTGSYTDQGLHPNYSADTIGARRMYRYELNLPEGTYDRLYLYNRMNQRGVGLRLENDASFDYSYTLTDIASINGVTDLSDNAKIEAAMNSVPADETNGDQTWNFGDVVTAVEDDSGAGGAVSPQIVVDIYIRLDNDANNQAGEERQTRGRAHYRHGETDNNTTMFNNPRRVTIVEPQLSVTKEGRNVTRGDSWGTLTNPDAGDVMEYRVTIRNAGIDLSRAWMVNVVDTLAEGMAYDATFTPQGDVTTDPDITGTGAGGDPQTFTWGREQSTPLTINIDPGDTFQWVYRAVVREEVEPDQDLANQVTVDWNSLDPAIDTGNIPDEDERRDGRDGAGGLNDYVAEDSVTPARRDDTAVDKTRTTDTYGAGDDDMRVGDIVTYTLTLTFDEGETDQVVVTDELPDGYVFLDTVSVGGDATPPYANPAPFTYADIPAGATPSAGDTGLVSWTFGHVYNASDNAGPDTVAIVYRARVADVGSLPDTPTTQNPLNTATVAYKLADGTDRSRNDTYTVSLLQPRLLASKSLRTGQDPVVEPGDGVAYRITVTNTGDSPAYNTVVRDVLPTRMRQTAPTVAASTLNGAAVALAAPTYDSLTGEVTWTLSDAQAIQPGQSLVIDVDAQVDANARTGLTLTNTVVADSYFSLPSSDANAAYRRQYRTSPPATVDVYTPGLAFSPNHENTTQPNTTLVYPHRLTVSLGGETWDLDFSLSSTKSMAWTVFRDTNGNGELDPSDPPVTGTLSVSSLDQVFFLKGHVPSDVPDNWVDSTEITAALSRPGVTLSRTNTDVTRVLRTPLGDMSAVKEAACDTDCDGLITDEAPSDQVFEISKTVGPGECALYRITFTNEGTGDLGNVEVHDECPEHTTYVGSSAAFGAIPANLAADAITEPADGGTGELVFTYTGTLIPGGTGTVTYQVRVRQ